MGEPKAPRQNRSINFRLHTLASSLFKGATQYYGAHFGIGLPEMRVLSNLGSEGPLAAYQIVALTAMDKALRFALSIRTRAPPVRSSRSSYRLPGISRKSICSCRARPRPPVPNRRR